MAKVYDDNWGASVNRDKCANVVLYFLEKCPDSGSTKLLKLLYLADSEHYRQHLRSITEATYVALERGPVLDKYKEHFESLENDGVLGRTLVPVHGDQTPMDRYTPRQHPNVEALEDSERAVLAQVYKRYGSRTGKELTALLHRDGPWSWVWDPEHPQGQEIPAALIRWAENFPTEADLATAGEELARDDVRAALQAIESGALAT